LSAAINRHDTEAPAPTC